MPKKKQTLNHVEQDKTSTRLDKWLWAARFFKTRSLAKNAIKLKRVKINDQWAQPSSTVKVDNIIVVQQGPFKKTVVVKAILDKRQSASIAQTLYSETTESIKAREKKVQELKTMRELKISPKPSKKPDKRDREKLRSLRRKDDN